MCAALSITGAYARKVKREPGRKRYMKVSDHLFEIYERSLTTTAKMLGSVLASA